MSKDSNGADFLVKIIEPSGKVYTIYPNGTIEGFAGDSIIMCRHFSLLNLAVAKERVDGQTSRFNTIPRDSLSG